MRILAIVVPLVLTFALGLAWSGCDREEGSGSEGGQGDGSRKVGPDAATKERLAQLQIEEKALGDEIGRLSAEAEKTAEEVAALQEKEAKRREILGEIERLMAQMEKPGDGK